MSQVPVQEIVVERLTKWAALCVERESTPVCLVAVGQNARLGDTLVCRTENGYSDQELGDLLLGIAAALLEQPWQS